MIEYYDIFEKMNEENQTQTESTPTPPVEAAPAEAPAAVAAATPAEPAAPEAAATLETAAPEQPAPEATATDQAAPEAPAAPAAPSFDPAQWDGQKKQIEKTFVKAFSPRLFRYPFSLEIDVLRGIKAAAAHSVEVVEPKQVMDTGGRFLSSVLLEVTGDIKEGASGFVKLSGEYYCHVVKRNFLGMQAEVMDVQKALDGVPKELYFWHATYPKYTGDEAKTVIIASTEVTPLPAKLAPAAAPAQPAAPTVETPASEAAAPATPETSAAQPETPTASAPETPAPQPETPAAPAPEAPAQPAAPETPAAQPEQQQPPQA